MSKPLSRRDWEILSAYLDEALKNGQKDKLEARLESDAELRDAHENLRRTRKLLRSSPQARPPHHFTVTRDMLTEKRGKIGSNAFSLNLLSAAASVLLVIVLIGDIGSFALPTASRTDSAPAEAFAEAEESMELMATAADEAVQPQAEEAEKAADDDSVADLQSDAIEAGAAVQGEEESSLAAAQEADRVAADDSPVEDDSVGEVQGEISENAETPKEEETPTLEPTITTPPPVAEVVSEPIVEDKDGESEISSFPLLRVIEILLGAVALSSALLARRLRIP